MGHASLLSAPDLEQALAQAHLAGAAASLRLLGATPRLQGDLRVHAFRPGAFLELAGLRARDLPPSEGTPVTLTVLLDEEVLTLESRVLPGAGDDSGLLLRLAWPREAARLHQRREVRVAAPEQSPLRIRVNLGGRRLEAMLVNLTETGVGLGLEEPADVDLYAPVEIDAQLPDGAVLRCPGEVRHITYLEGQPYPARLGVVLQPRPDTDLDPIHRFIQARRTDLSQRFRQS
ncbi:PilZ domain-containing protein [Geothrix sp. 21YS21S-4]|uniref:PilZ domain-containing protein n=1 Tax=Geothrix sp. 21YS21S-4 TaxID=3068889 RepID=UPI0027B98591|nr:PilZ domain-containing protein [Geothrix sp. 21YS21S-4]